MLLRARTVCLWQLRSLASNSLLLENTLRALIKNLLAYGRRQTFPSSPQENGNRRNKGND